MVCGVYVQPHWQISHVVGTLTLSMHRFVVGILVCLVMTFFSSSSSPSSSTSWLPSSCWLPWTSPPPPPPSSWSTAAKVTVGVVGGVVVAPVLVSTSLALIGFGAAGMDGQMHVSNRGQMYVSSYA